MCCNNIRIYDKKSAGKIYLFFPSNLFADYLSHKTYVQLYVDIDLRVKSTYMFNIVPRTIEDYNI